ncbi:TIGR04197 family type VII secretion effector [Streptococcus oricebi]|uniref:Uncharacterized protein n=1 Tax=Streptococcus oricebi TaxID=1547447 RepID=A0ABS5B4M1_9STRE|nr:TIGR04197 family type VII secretion effector [Streptococcus oricebi]MBP2623456.1 hypothetical protein [Streptococcus oricebi]
MVQVQSNSSSAKACASSLMAAATSLISTSSIQEDSSSNYVGNDLLKELFASEETLTTNVAAQIEKFVGLVHGVHKGFDASDQWLAYQLQKNSYAALIGQSKQNSSATSKKKTGGK